MKYTDKDYQEWLEFRQFMKAKKEFAGSHPARPRLPAPPSPKPTTGRKKRISSKRGVNIALVLKCVPSLGSVTRAEILDKLPNLTPMQVDTALSALVRTNKIKRIRPGLYELS